MSLLRASLLLLGLIALGVVLALIWYARAAAPLHQGELILAGLRAEVRVVRDGDAVPHIEARSEDDALFALGFVHAQDRLWQLEFNRRIAQGRLAEILGPAGLETDRFLRTLGVARTATAVVANLDADTRAKLAAYAAGINAYLASRTQPLPPEFVLTRAPAPAPWQPEDSVAWAMMMAWDLSAGAMRNELARLRLSSKLSRADIDDLRPPYPGEQPLKVADYVDVYRALGLRSPAVARAAGEITAQSEALAFGSGEGIGSNNWVVAGALSASGKPLLANDPHLGLTAPSVWYFAHLRAPELEVFGASLPGVPYVLLGRNRHVAWGFTNTGPDVLDLYIERVNPANGDEYLTPSGYQRFATRIETIKVRGADDVQQVVRATRHGPVISSALSAADQALPPKGTTASYVLALRWAALEPQDATMRAVRAMNRAVTAAEFERALRDWQVVQQNIVYADDRGTIGMVAPGRVPLRRADNDLKGLVPAPGWDARYDWAGWLSFEQMPRVVNPADGIIVTANHKITPPGYKHYLTSEWYLPYRAHRIRHLLQAEAKHTPQSFARIQGDIVSLAAQDLLASLRDAQPATAGGRAALERLRVWNGAMSVDGPEPLLLHAWLRKLRTRIFDDDLGELATEFVGNAELMQATLNVLRGSARARDWCDDRATPRHETCLELAGEALDEAVADLARGTGRDIAGLRWGDARVAVLEHRPLSNVGLVRNWFQLTTPYPGDTFTVNVAQLTMKGDAPFNTRHAASLRAIYDLTPDAGARWIYGGGQVGQPWSKHYRDLLERWSRVDYASFDWKPAKPQHTLLLRPAK
jgi:penicillin amidase